MGFFYEIFVFFASIFLTLGFTLLFLLLSPIYLYRWIIFRLAPRLRPDLGKMLSSRSSLSAVDSINVAPNINLMIGLVVGGPLDIDQFRKQFTNTVLGKDPLTSEFKRPELQQYICQWPRIGGFFFWRPESNFRIEEHIQEYKADGLPSRINDRALREIVLSILKQPHPKEKSPWRLWVVSNYFEDTGNGIEPKSALLWLIHHSICDGFSIAKMIAEALDRRPEDVLIEHLYANRNRKQPGIFKRTQKALGFFGRAMVEFFPTLLRSVDRNDWTFPENELTKEVVGSFRDKISMNYLKDIRNLHGVGVTSVIYAGFAGAIREYMLRSGVRVPKKMHAFIPLPVPGHPGHKLRNHMTIAIIELPLGVSEPVQRLRMIHQSLEHIKKSTIPGAFFFLMKLTGGLLPWMIRIGVKNVLTTSALTSMPGSKYHGWLCGVPVEDIMFAAGLLPGSLVLGFTSCSYNGMINVCGGADKKIVPSYERAEELMDFFMRELDILSKIDPEDFA